MTMLPAAAPGGVEEYPDLWHALYTAVADERREGMNNNGLKNQLSKEV